jgi:hypothetical protein
VVVLKAGKTFVEPDLRSTHAFIPGRLVHGPQGSVLRGKYCHVSIFHVTIPASSKSFSVKSRHVSVISFRSILFLLLSPPSVNFVHSIIHLLLCLWCQSSKHHQLCIAEIGRPNLALFLIPLVKMVLLVIRTKLSDRFLIGSKLGEL